MKRLLLAAAFAGFCGTGAMAQSFDCSGGLAADEQAICDSRKLSRLDVELSDVYEDVLSKSSERTRERIRGEQRDWIATRRACRDRYSCLSRLYLDRISELEDRKERDGRSASSGVAFDGRDNWMALGSVEAGYRSEPLSVLVGFSRGRFDALQLRVRDSGARIRRLTVVYGNGMSQSFRFRRVFRAGQLSQKIGLRARSFGRFIERIIIEAKARPGTRIDVIGRRSEGRFEDRRLSRNNDDRQDDQEIYRDRDRYADDEPGSDRSRDSYRDRYVERDDFSDRERPSDRDENSDRNRYSDAERDAGAGRNSEQERYANRDADQFDDQRGDERDTARGDDYGLGDGYDFGDRDQREDDRDERRADVSREGFLDFVKNVFHHTADMSEGELRDTYASRVDYYGERRKAVAEIVADKRNYAERWSDRAFRVRDETFRYEETSEPGVYELTYTYDFHVRGDGRESKGSGETTLLVDANARRYVILKEDGKVVQRF